MKDTVDSFAQTAPNQDHHHPIPIDLDLEATDPLAKHEITLQFAAFRALSSCGGGSGEADGTRYQSGGGGAGGGVLPSPTSLYFTYQFYSCLPTRTERMLLRPDGRKDRLYQVVLLFYSRLSKQGWNGSIDYQFSSNNFGAVRASYDAGRAIDVPPRTDQK